MDGDNDKGWRRGREGFDKREKEKGKRRDKVEEINGEVIEGDKGIEIK